MQQQSRYIVETNIERFKEHLRSGLLDAEQTRTVMVLLAEACAELSELDHLRAVERPPTAAQGFGANSS
jgi:hypothetical protein